MWRLPITIPPPCIQYSAGRVADGVVRAAARKLDLDAWLRGELNALDVGYGTGARTPRSERIIGTVSAREYEGRQIRRLARRISGSSSFWTQPRASCPTEHLLSPHRSDHRRRGCRIPR